MGEDARALDGQQGRRHGRQARLHVARAPAIDPAPARGRPKGVARPALAGRDSVEVTAQDQRRARAADSGVQVGPARSHLDQTAIDALVPQERGEKLSAGRLVARRVLARLGDQPTKQDKRFVLVYGIKDATVTAVETAGVGARRLVPPGEIGTMSRPGYRKCRTGRLGRATNGPVKTAPAFRHDQLRGPE